MQVQSKLSIKCEQSEDLIKCILSYMPHKIILRTAGYSSESYHSREMQDLNAASVSIKTEEVTVGW
jgi:hypothetical protein